MICKKPWKDGALAGFPCGQCNPCRFNKRREWTHRLILESKLHESSSFVTLTYAPCHYPEGGGLVPSHVQRFIRAARKRLGAGVLRYFSVGEYGDETQRAHYHAILFGCGPDAEESIRKSWQFGFVDYRELSPDLCQYIAGYVVKKLTRKDDPRLNGRYPEFARMSLKPGIGSGYMGSIAEPLHTRAGARFVESTGDVPSVLRTDGKKLPLGRYLRRKLREEMGFEEPGQPAKAAWLQAQEMRSVWNASTDKTTLVEDLKAERQQKARAMEGRMLINESRKHKLL